MRLANVICDYCGKAAVLVDGRKIYPDNPRTHGKHFWHCAPCDAWTACHENSPSRKPIGRLANGELRESRKRALSAFNPLWIAGHAMLINAGRDASKSYCVGIAYKWLADRMAIRERTCHIGSFDAEQCDRARKICQSLGNELLVRFQNELSK